MTLDKKHNDVIVRIDGIQDEANRPLSIGMYNLRMNRRKERQLKNIIAKVILWRRLYTGIIEVDAQGT